MQEKFKINYVKAKDEKDIVYIGAILNDKMIGHLTYKIKEDSAWLYFVGVDRDYRHLKDEQVGSNLMRIFENDCVKHRLWCLEGKFWPKGEEGDVVRRFYNRNGYEIEREDYDLIVYKTSPQMTDLPFEVEDIPYEIFDKMFEAYNQKDQENELE